MNFCDDLEKFSSNTALITEQSNIISYKNLLLEADNIGNHVKNILPTNFSNIN